MDGWAAAVEQGFLAWECGMLRSDNDSGTRLTLSGGSGIPQKPYLVGRYDHQYVSLLFVVGSKADPSGRGRR